MLSNKIVIENKHAIQRLTALWALSESGLGAIMFALKIPLTGFFLGGFAIIILSLIAKFSNNSFRQIINATIIVLMVKAIASPHSPPPAYLAVAFQGFVAAVVFNFFSVNKFACIIIGMITMVESALQKIIVLTLLFSKSLWVAIDGLFAQINKEFSLHFSNDFSFWLIVIYAIIYAVWGAIVGVWASKIPANIEENKERIIEEYNELANISEIEVVKKNSSNFLKRIIFFVGVLIFIGSVFLLTGSNTKQLLFIFSRSIAALLLLFWIVKPLATWLVQRWMKNRTGKQKESAEAVLLLLPQVKQYVAASYQMSKQSPQGLQRWRRFVLNLIVVTLYAK